MSHKIKSHSDDIYDLDLVMMIIVTGILLSPVLIIMGIIYLFEQLVIKVKELRK